MGNNRLEVLDFGISLSKPIVLNVPLHIVHFLGLTIYSRIMLKNKLTIEKQRGWMRMERVS